MLQVLETKSLKQTNLTTMSKKQIPPKTKSAKIEVIYLGIDVHTEKQVVVRQMGADTPQPAQRFNREKLIHWIARQLELAEEVYTCYEAGPFGYGLHRELEAMGVHNVVVRPRNWDEYGQKVKTDGRDALALTECLSRYVSGNKSALSVVRVPSESEERKRSLGRQRDAMKRELQRLAAMGRGNAAYYGERIKGTWWGPRYWKRLQVEFPKHLLDLLEPLRRLLHAVEAELNTLTKKIEDESKSARPKGLGALTSELILREVGDWTRFSNRRQVASYTGLCPREDSSGGRRFQGSINKHGNPRLRRLLIEATWRIIRYQPKYKRLEKWWDEMKRTGGKIPPGQKKKMVVAIARQLQIDLWRINTGRTTCEQLGLEMLS
jgi:transposase